MHPHRLYQYECILDLIHARNAFGSTQNYLQVLAAAIIDSFVFHGPSGVVLASGERLAAALVVDTSGARSKGAIDFLKERGVQRVPCIRVDPGLSYYTRYFKMPEEVLYHQLPSEYAMKLLVSPAEQLIRDRQRSI